MVVKLVGWAIKLQYLNFSGLLVAKILPLVLLGTETVDDKVGYPYSTP